MTEGNFVPPEGDQTTSQSTGQSAEQSWREVGKQFEELGATLAQTVRAAWEREDTQQRVQEMQNGLEKMVQEVRGAIDDSMNTPQGQRIREDANRAAESLRTACEQTVQEVRPQIINALQQLNNELQQWINKMENRTQPPDEPMNDDDGVAGTA